MSKVIHIVNGEAAQANVRSDLDLTAKKKPWEPGYAGGEEFKQKNAYQQSLGDSGKAIISPEEE